MSRRSRSRSRRTGARSSSAVPSLYSPERVATAGLCRHTQLSRERATQPGQRCRSLRADRARCGRPGAARRRVPRQGDEEHEDRGRRDDDRAAQHVGPRVAAGAHDFVNFACAQCHGLDGRGGVSPFVPALKDAQALTTAELKQIIDHGAGVSANPTHPYMPVWGQVISDRQVDDLVAYIHAGLPAVPTATPVQVPTGQGRGRPGTGPVHALRLHQLPRTERARRGAQPAVARQDDPTALRRRLLQRVRHGREDPRLHRLGQRPRQGADREHAALGRHHPAGAPERARRLHQDAQGQDLRGREQHAELGVPKRGEARRTLRVSRGACGPALMSRRAERRRLAQSWASPRVRRASTASAF